MTTKTDGVVEALGRRVESGEWVPGIRLPAIEVLMEEFLLSRGTIRLALERLQERGLIYKRGNGWYVGKKKTPQGSDPVQ